MTAGPKIGVLGHRTIDCDVHPAIPDVAALLPYLDDHWREMITLRGIDRMVLNLASHPPTAPLSCRPDWRPPSGKPGSDPARLIADAVDGFGSEIAILNCLFGGLALHGDDMVAALCRAANDWLAAEFLAADPRLRASILVPQGDPGRAVAEIEHRAADPRFVQVLMLAAVEMPLGRRYFWPIYEAAERHGLTIGVHAGGTARHPPTTLGWPSYLVEDYANNASAAAGQVMSFVAEGVFQKFPRLKVVFLETGFSWLPALMWRANKTWRGVRPEVPWVDEPPAEIIRRHLRFSIQPADIPDAATLATILGQLGGDDMLLFASDYPHWHYDGTDALPAGIDGALRRRILSENALATYPRLREALGAEAGGAAAAAPRA